MINCTCCQPQKTFSALKSLYRHQRKYDPTFIEGEHHTFVKRKQSYELNPKLCQNCNIALSYLNRKGKFCSHTCSVTVSNKNRVNQKSIRYCSLSTCNNELTIRASKFCSSKCHNDHKWVTFKNSPNAIWTSSRRKKQLLEELGHQCQKCENTEWLGSPITLEIEHIDGNSQDHSRENTTLLCPNCHSMTPTYKAKNVGNGRHSRRCRYQEGKSW